MAGLLDSFTGNSIDDPRTTGLLALAASLSSSPRVTQGLSQGLLQRQQIIGDAAKQNAQSQMMALQLQQAQKAAEDQQRQRDFLSGLQGPRTNAAQAALAGGGGPTMANAQQMAPVDPYQENLFNAVKAGVLPYDQYLASQRKDSSPLKLAAGEALVDPKTFKPIFTNPKEDSTPSAVKEYSYAVKQGYPGSFLDFQLAQKRAGASSVSVNTGQHGFDNTLKLRGDFRSEPIYKAQQEMQSAYSQIKQSLGQASPAGDLAGATKLMKLLDPGSVVRESELGMAMAATGLLDRARNYASMVAGGTKLTPNQRKEFQTLADALYGESAKAYNSKRGEYSAIADRNGLNVLDVIGAEASAPQQATPPGAFPGVDQRAIEAEIQRRMRGGR